MQKEKRFAPKTIDAERTIGRMLPASLDAERSVLAALLLNDENVPLASEIICADDFYHTAHKLIYQAILDLSLAKQRIDLVTLQDELAKRGQLEQCGRRDLFGILARRFACDWICGTACAHYSPESGIAGTDWFGGSYYF